jgi:hypothetical protein
MSQETKFCGVLVDLNARQLEVMAVATLSAQYTEKLVEEADMVDGNREFNMTAVAGTAVQRVEAASCASAMVSI